MSNGERIYARATCSHFLQVAPYYAVVAQNATTEPAQMNRRANIATLVVEDAKNVKKGLTNG